jgi:hypothetical protein
VIYWFVIFSFILALVAFIWHASRGVARNLSFIPVVLDELLKRGYNCAFVVIKISYTNKFIQLRKYIDSPSNYGIQLGFPKVKWSLPYFDDVNNICGRVDSKSMVVSDGQLDFLYVDFGQDVLKASECVRRILTEVFGVTPKTKLFINLENAATE